MKYIIYNKNRGEIWRELDQYVVEDDGTIFGGLNGVNTLRYPPSVGVGVLEINDDDFAALDYDCWEKYKVENGEIIDNPNYKPPFDAETKTTNLEEQVIDLQLALCEMYETMTETEE